MVDNIRREVDFVMEQMAEPCPVTLFYAYLPVCGAVQYDFGLRWDRGCRVECESVVRYPFIFAHGDFSVLLYSIT